MKLLFGLKNEELLCRSTYYPILPYKGVQLDYTCFLKQVFLRADIGHVLGRFLAFAQISAALLIENLLVVPTFGSYKDSFPSNFMA